MKRIGFDLGFPQKHLCISWILKRTIGNTRAFCPSQREREACNHCSSTVQSNIDIPGFLKITYFAPKLHTKQFKHSEPFEVTHYRLIRSWHDLDLSLKAACLFFLAISLLMNRFAFFGRLSRRFWREQRLVRASKLSLRRRSWRMMPSNSGQTLCCIAADVSMNLQSKTAADERPSEKYKRRKKE